MTLIEQLKTIADPRSSIGQRHPLWLILFLSLLGSLCGYWGYRPLAHFSRKHHVSLCQLLELPLTTTMPSYSTFRRVFQQVDAQHWVNLFNTWSLLHVPELSGRLLATDGKSIKCTSTGGNSAQQDFATLVSVFGHADEGVVQLQLMHNKKTSEIEIAKQLFEQLPQPQRPCCLSLDALHAQVESVKTLCTLGLAYLIGLKRNQPTLYRIAQSQHEQGHALSQASHWEQGHGRQVERRVWVYAAPVELQQRWQGLTRLIWVERQGRRGKVPYQQQHCYLSSCDWTAEQFLAAIRGHWSIENKLHWVKDVTFGEDDPPRRGGHAPVSWAIFHSFFITIARRLGFRTVPDAQRDLANQVQQVFSLLV
jgi:predicted transposase YbfD/YdcC